MKKKAILVSPVSMDIRTYKFVIELINKNYDVIIACHIDNGINLFKDELSSYIDRLSIIDIGDKMQANMPFNISRNRKIRNLIKKECPDVLIVRDIFISTFLNNRIKKYVKDECIVDICDNYPEVLDVIIDGNKKSILCSIANYIEKKVLKKFDRAIFVSNDSKNYILNKHGINLRNLIICNVPRLKDVDNNYIDYQDNKKGDLLYIGTLSKKIRDLCTVFKAIEYLKYQYKMDIKMDIYYFENQISIVNEYKIIVNELNLTSQVKFIPAVKKSELNDVIRSYKVGVVCHCRNKATDYTIPNKLYDYMSNSRCVLVSDNPSLVNVINQYNIGEFYKGNDYKDCAKKIKKIVENNKYLNECGENGFKAIVDELNWENMLNKSFWRQER